MYAIAFDMVVADLKQHYGEHYNNAYYDISKVLRGFGFSNAQGSVYLSDNNDMANLYMAIEALKGLEWFRKSVRDIRAFKVEDWSNFTQVVKGV